MDGTSLPNCYAFPYLGVFFTGDGKTDHNWETRRARASSRFYTLSDVWNDTALSIDIKVRLYRSLVVSVLSSSPSCVPPSPSLQLATPHSKCTKCKTRPKARRALFTPSTPQPIAISSSPSTSKGGTAARNAAESYEASAGLYRYTLADYQSPSTTYGGAATAAGCNSPYLATMSSGPSKSNLYKE